jgi:hypothetical protein
MIGIRVPEAVPVFLTGRYWPTLGLVNTIGLPDIEEPVF